MTKKGSIYIERTIYIISAALIPNIVLFHLYNKNALRGISFSHCLYFGAAIAAISVVLFFVTAKFIRYRRSLLTVALFWIVFWYYNQFYRQISHYTTIDAPWFAAILMFTAIVAVAYGSTYLKVNRLIINTTAGVLCLLFFYNFIPAVTLNVTATHNSAISKTEGLPYKVKNEYEVNPDAPHPNIYWIHMDAAVGFDAVEKYFNDPQIELKQQLTERGFVINESARLGAGGTIVAVPALVMPTFYDSYLADEFDRVANLTKNRRVGGMLDMMQQKGFAVNDVFPYSELINAFKAAGYTTAVDSYNMLHIGGVTVASDVLFDTQNITTNRDDTADEEERYSHVVSFYSMVCDASALTLARSAVEYWLDKMKPVVSVSPTPDYQGEIDKIFAEQSGLSYESHRFSDIITSAEYSNEIASPHIVYFFNDTAHVDYFDNNVGINRYNFMVGYTFFLNENGHYYNEAIADPYDIQKLYPPQHKYAMKTMLTTIDMILEREPDAVIVLEADHGIHNLGFDMDGYDENIFTEHGYSIEDMINLNLDVLSAVRIPEKFGKLDKPLDPLNITRWLVNHYVGDNYDYLPQENEGTYK